MRILLIGGGGLLGRELLKLDETIIAPTKSVLNIQNIRDIDASISIHKPNIIINAAAETNDREISVNPQEAILTNIIGSALIALWCHENNIRLVYISTDYVYKGDAGGYNEESELSPVNPYAWTKLGGECSANQLENHLIIRTSFGASKFPYMEAFNNKFTSKDYVDVIAPMILKAAKSKLKGVINIGTPRKSFYNYALERNPNIIKKETPYSDHSFDLTKWNKFNYED